MARATILILAMGLAAGLSAAGCSLELDTTGTQSGAAAEGDPVDAGGYTSHHNVDGGEADAGDAGAADGSGGEADAGVEPDGGETVEDAGAAEDAEADAGSEDASEPEPEAEPEPECGMLAMAVRDFSREHPDFSGSGPHGHEPGLVDEYLGEDGLPVLAPDARGIGAETFAEWYRGSDGVNHTFERALELEPNGDGWVAHDAHVFEDGELVEAYWEHPPFSPLSCGEGWGCQDGQELSSCPDGVEANFWFTAEIRASFIYEGGETLRAAGDDDLWVFVNGRIAMDMGQRGVPELGSLELDAIAESHGLGVGEPVDVDIFYAARGPCGAVLYLETDACLVSRP